LPPRQQLKSHKEVWLPADFERAVKAVAEIERIDSLHALEGDNKTKREAYAKQISEIDRMIFKLKRVRKRAWTDLGWPSKNSKGEPTPSPSGRP
jgi:hypothetical protein